MDLRSDLRSHIQVHFLLVKLDFGRTDDSSRLAHNVVVCSGQFFVDVSCDRAEPLCYFFLFVNFFSKMREKVQKTATTRIFRFDFDLFNVFI